MIPPKLSGNLLGVNYRTLLYYTGECGNLYLSNRADMRERARARIWQNTRHLVTSALVINADRARDTIVRA